MTELRQGAPAADLEEVVPTEHRYIVVEGPIGVGKTSLARRLSRSFGSELVLEQDDENPFLERFYRNPRAAAFQTHWLAAERPLRETDLVVRPMHETVRALNLEGRRCRDHGDRVARRVAAVEIGAVPETRVARLVQHPPSSWA